MLGTMGYVLWWNWLLSGCWQLTVILMGRKSNLYPVLSVAKCNTVNSLLCGLSHWQQLFMVVLTEHQTLKSLGLLCLNFEESFQSHWCQKVITTYQNYHSPGMFHIIIKSYNHIMMFVQELFCEETLECSNNKLLQYW